MSSNECYVCLEETEEQSPCACKLPLHASCFFEMQHKMHASSCTICQRSFRIPFSGRDACLLVLLFVTCLAMVTFIWFLIEGTYAR